MRAWPVAALFVLAGALHFVLTNSYVRVMPPYLPWPRSLVLISGAAEIAGGAGMLVKPLRRAAGWGLAALLIAVFPANFYMAQQRMLKPEWIRLPLQVVLIRWVLWAGNA